MEILLKFKIKKADITGNISALLDIEKCSDSHYKRGELQRRKLIFECLIFVIPYHNLQCPLHNLNKTKKPKNNQRTNFNSTFVSNYKYLFATIRGQDSLTIPFM